MNKEVWNKVPGFEGYEVSNMGNVRSYRFRGGNGGLRETSKPLRKWADDLGYQHVTLMRANKRIPSRVHQIVLFAFVGPKPEGYHGAHLNGKPWDNRLSNLAWVTPKENAAHRKLHGTQPMGEESYMAKLTNDEVLNIKSRLLAGEHYRDIANDYSVGWHTVRCILTGKSWSHIGPDVTVVYEPRKYVDIDADEIIAAVEAGEKIVSISERLGHDVSNISRTFKNATGIGIRQYKAAKRAGAA